MADVLALNDFLYIGIVTPLLLIALLGFMKIIVLIVEMGPPKVRPGWICGVVGRMGQGKSLFAMYRVRKALQFGSPVIVNFTIRAEAHPNAVVYNFTSWETLLDALVDRMVEAIGRGWDVRDYSSPLAPAPALCVADEFHLFAPASGMVLPDAARYMMSHFRKFNVEMLWISQHEGRVASAVRDATAEMIEVKRKTSTWFRATTWEPETFRKKGADFMWAQRYRLSPAVTSIYGSWELLRPDEHADRDGLIRKAVERVAEAQRMFGEPVQPLVELYGEDSADYMPGENAGVLVGHPPGAVLAAVDDLFRALDTPE